MAPARMSTWSVFMVYPPFPFGPSGAFASLVTFLLVYICPDLAGLKALPASLWSMPTLQALAIFPDRERIIVESQNPEPELPALGHFRSVLSRSAPALQRPLALFAWRDGEFIRIRIRNEGR